MQQESLHLCLTAVIAHGWECAGAPFQVQAPYQTLLGMCTKEDVDFSKACQCIWRIFSLLLPKRQLVTCAYQRKWQPNAPTKCILCDEITKDVPHLFSNCAFTRRVRANQQITGLDISLAERFWSIGLSTSLGNAQVEGLSIIWARVR